MGPCHDTRCMVLYENREVDVHVLERRPGMSRGDTADISEVYKLAKLSDPTPISSATGGCTWKSQR